MKKSKKWASFQGELMIITSSNDVWKPVIRALQLYGSGGLKDPDTQDLRMNDKKWLGNSYAVPPLSAYTFKTLRGFGPSSLLELTEKILDGVDEEGRVIKDRNPKVFLGKFKPKKFADIVSLPEWMERKRFKNTVVMELHRRGGVPLIWTESGDVNTLEWRSWKSKSGFLRMHMDELIRRAGNYALVLPSLIPVMREP